MQSPHLFATDASNTRQGFFKPKTPRINETQFGLHSS
jgi:hypothetical protein